MAFEFGDGGLAFHIDEDEGRFIAFSQRVVAVEEVAVATFFGGQTVESVVEAAFFHPSLVFDGAGGVCQYGALNGAGVLALCGERDASEEGEFVGFYLLALEGDGGLRGVSDEIVGKERRHRQSSLRKAYGR